MIHKERLEKEILKELSLGLLKSDNEIIRKSTITDVELTNDLRIASVYIMSPDKGALAEFEKSTGFLKTILSKTLRIKRVPKLLFYPDTSFEEGRKIEKLIKEL